jgi:DNA-binding XRE family transcriptional regulator
MRPTDNPDAPPLEGDDGRLNVDLIDKLARKRGITSVEKLAAHCGVSRSHMFNLRSGKVTASIPVGLRMARRMRTTVEKLFGGGQVKA